MAYKIALKKKAIKALEKINEPYYSNILKAIYSLADNPRPIGCKKLKGSSSYRIRVADYRIVYDIFDSMLIIEIVNVGSRGGVYDE